MTYKYKEPIKEIPLVNSFLNLVVKLITIWLELFPKYLQSVKNNISILVSRMGNLSKFVFG